MLNYRAYIKNITKNKWVLGVHEHSIEYGWGMSDALAFHDEADAENTLARLNDENSDAFVLVSDNFYDCDECQNDIEGPVYRNDSKYVYCADCALTYGAKPVPAV